MCCFVLYLLDIRQIDGNANFKNEFCSCINRLHKRLNSPSLLWWHCDVGVINWGVFYSDSPCRPDLRFDMDLYRTTCCVNFLQLSSCRGFVVQRVAQQIKASGGCALASCLVLILCVEVVNVKCLDTCVVMSWPMSVSDEDVSYVSITKGKATDMSRTELKCQFSCVVY